MTGISPVSRRTRSREGNNSCPPGPISWPGVVCSMGTPALLSLPGRLGVSDCFMPRRVRGSLDQERGVGVDRVLYDVFTGAPLYDPTPMHHYNVVAEVPRRGYVVCDVYYAEPLSAERVQ